MAIPVAGTAFLFVDGNQYPLRGNLTIGPLTVERTMLAGQDGIHGYQELPVVPFVECDITTDPSIDWTVLETFTNITVQANLINGQQFVLSRACVSGRRELNTREGMSRVRFEGMGCVQLNP
jgi:hypothetical protein